MKEKEPIFGPRSDFPVRQLVRKICLGNIMVTGSLYTTVMSLEVYDDFVDGRIDRMIYSISRQSSDFISDELSDPLNLSMLLLFGSLFSMFWYAGARVVETRAMKKRWLVVTADEFGQTLNPKSQTTQL